MANLLSDVAIEIMRAASTGETLLSNTWKPLILEMFDVPERPKDFSVQMVQVSALDIAIPVTGGLDSTVLWWRSRLQARHVAIKPYYVDFGQPYLSKEMKALWLMGVPVIRINTKPISYMSWKHILPGRNFLIISLIAEQMNKQGVIWFGAVDGEMPYSGGDKSHLFLTMVNALLQKLPFPVLVTTPLQTETKVDIVKWAVDNGYSDDLTYTVSCFSPANGHCGQCQACLRKAMAFACNDLELATVVPVKQGCVEFIEKYKIVLNRALETNDFSKYSERRCKQDLKALELL